MYLISVFIIGLIAGLIYRVVGKPAMKMNNRGHDFGGIVWLCIASSVTLAVLVYIVFTIL